MTARMYAAFTAQANYRTTLMESLNRPSRFLGELPQELIHEIRPRLHMSSNRAGPEPSRTGVRSMMTVTYLSPRRVCLHT